MSQTLLSVGRQWELGNGTGQSGLEGRCPSFPAEPIGLFLVFPGQVWNVLGEVEGVSWKKLLYGPEHRVPAGGSAQFPALRFDPGSRAEGSRPSFHSSVGPEVIWVTEIFV